jgi:hypothetical protein
VISRPLLRLPGSSWKKSKRRVANEHDKVVEIRR